jgi:hypothetical protein
MPSSAPLGKKWSREKVLSLRPRFVLDIGAGKGTYYDLLEPDLGALWVALVVWGPYTTRFQLSDRYRKVVVADVNYVDWKKLCQPAGGVFDLTIMGDVYEHIAESDAEALWDTVRRYAKNILVSIPVNDSVAGPCVQGVVFGNPYETHRLHWDAERVLALPGVVEHHVEQRRGKMPLTIVTVLARGLVGWS